MLFYEIKVKYQRQTGEDNPGSVSETYLVEGLNCADVENRLMDEIKSMIFGDCEVPSIKKSVLYDLVPSPDGDIWYKGRVEMITVGDDGKEKRKAVTILIQSTSIDEAVKGLRHHLNGIDSEIVSIQKSPILEVYRAV